MLKTMILCILVLTISFLSFSYSAKLYLQGMDSIQISLLPEYKIPTNGTDVDKNTLRYGFHRTYDCQDFTKAFMCIRKCLDLDYQIAHADKDCICICYKNKVLSHYKERPTNQEKSVKGAPTTRLPPWVKATPEPLSFNIEIDGNYSTSDESTLNEEKHQVDNDHSAVEPQGSAELAVEEETHSSTDAPEGEEQHSTGVASEEGQQSEGTTLAGEEQTTEADPKSNNSGGAGE